MNISQESAKESLNAVKDTITQTRKAISASYAADLLILWGLILIAGFMGCHFYPKYGGQIFTSLDVLGFIGTFWIIRVGCQKAPVKSTTTSCGKIGWKIFWFWASLGIYITALLFILQPNDGRQIAAFFLITSMLAYNLIPKVPAGPKRFSPRHPLNNQSSRRPKPHLTGLRSRPAKRSKLGCTPSSRVTSCLGLHSANMAQFGTRRFSLSTIVSGLGCPAQMRFGRDKCLRSHHLTTLRRQVAGDV